MSTYSQALQQLIVDQIQLEFQASHIYKGFGNFLKHPQMAYPGFSKFFLNESEEELKHAQAFIDYHQKRGFFTTPPAIAAIDNKVSPVDAIKRALTVEQQVLDNLNKISKIADPQTQTFIEDYLTIQTDSIAEYTEMLTKVLRVENDNLGLYMLDKEFQ